MELIKTNIKPYPIFSEVISLIKKELPEAVIAGGAISDNIMYRNFRDLDIFTEKVDEKAFSNLSNSLENFCKIYSFDKDYGNMVTGLYKFNYKGYKGHLVVTTDIFEKINHFDLSFRQAMYNGSQIFASHKALRDIKAKTLRPINFNSPIVTLSRIVKFQYRYKFEVSEKAFNYLLQNITNDPKQLQIFKDKKYPKKVRKKMLEYLSQMQDVSSHYSVFAK